MQDPSIYQDTGIDDNYTYPVIKAGILEQQNSWLVFMANTTLELIVYVQVG